MVKKRTGKKTRTSGLKMVQTRRLGTGGGLAEAALLKQKADLYGFWWYGFGTAKVDLTRPAPARGAGGLSYASRHRRPVVFGYGRFIPNILWHGFGRFFGLRVSAAFFLFAVLGSTRFRARTVLILSA